MPELTTSARIPKKTVMEYRKWAALTGRSLTGLLNIALLFALRKQSEVEREGAMKLEDK
jgi:hypothetical protein